MSFVILSQTSLANSSCISSTFFLMFSYALSHTLILAITIPSLSILPPILLYQYKMMYYTYRTDEKLEHSPIFSYLLRCILYRHALYICHNHLALRLPHICLYLIACNCLFESQCEFYPALLSSIVLNCIH